MFEDKLAIAFHVIIVENAITPLAEQFAKARLAIIEPFPATDLTGLFWTKQCENMSLERSFGYAEEEVQR